MSIYKFNHVGGTYSTYPNLIKDIFPDYINNYINGGSIDINGIYKLIGIHKHLRFGNDIGLFQNIKTQQVFLYNLSYKNFYKKILDHKKHYKSI